MPDISNIEKILSSLKTDNSKVLGVAVGTTTVTPGLYIPKAEAQDAPTLSFKGAGPYIVVGLDLDAPFQSITVLGPILHWIQSGLKPDGAGSVLSSAGTPFVANFIGPAPPPFSGPHRYAFFLYDQPADFDYTKHAPAGGKRLGNGSRMRYDLRVFEKKAGLGPVLAANYFTSN